jgi:hypothetical protein
MCPQVHLLNCGLSPSGRPGDHILLSPARVEVATLFPKRRKRKGNNMDTRPRKICNPEYQREKESSLQHTHHRNFIRLNTSGYVRRERVYYY